MTLSTNMVALVGIGCEAFFYGCYTILFGLSIYLIFHGPRRGTSFNKPIFIISGLLYLSCSTHFVLQFSNIFYGFFKTKGRKGSAEETLIALAVTTDLFVSITNFVGELILIYRCWLLWSRNYWVIILPSLFSIASLVCFSVSTPFMLHANPNSSMMPPSIIPLNLAAFSLPLGTNVLVTSLIAARIWYLSPRKARNMGSAQFPTRTGQVAVDIVVESGMLYIAVQLVLVVLFAIVHPAVNIVRVIAVQIYGIAPTLILIRVSLGFSNMQKQNGPILGGPTSSTQVPVHTTSFVEPGRRLQVPAEMSVSEIKSKGSSRDLGSASSSVEDVASVAV